MENPDEGNTCAACGEPLDEYMDCLESLGGKHRSVKSVRAYLNRLRKRFPRDFQHVVRASQGETE